MYVCSLQSAPVDGLCQQAEAKHFGMLLCTGVVLSCGKKSVGQPITLPQLKSIAVHGRTGRCLMASTSAAACFWLSMLWLSALPKASRAYEPPPKQW